MLSMLCSDIARREAFLFCLVLILLCPEAQGQSHRDFPLPDGLVTDLAGVLSEEKLAVAEEMLRGINETKRMDGRVVIVPETSEWYFGEFLKDYADFLVAEGLMGENGWVLYVSVEDRKFGLAVEDRVKSVIGSNRVRDIELIMSQRLQEGDLEGAVVSALNAIRELGSVPDNRPVRRSSTNGLIVFGVLVLIVTIVMKSKRQAREVMNRK